MQATVSPGFLGNLFQRSNYAYANARVRVRKGKLLPADAYAKLLKMGVNEIARFMDETPYKREIDELSNLFTGIDLLENALNVNEERTYHEVRKFARGQVGGLVHRYLERYTVWNIKTILRGRFFGARPEEMQGELLIGNRDNYDFYKTLMEAEGEGLGAVVEALAASVEGQPFHKALRNVESVSEVDDAAKLRLYEDALDRVYYENLVSTINARDPDEELFLRFVRKEIDAINLSLVLRFEWRNDPTEAAMEYLIPGGLEFSVADLKRLAEANNRDDLVERVKDFPIFNDLQEAFAQAQETGSLVPVQVALSKHLGDYVQRFSHRNPLSVLPIINYLMRKHLEVRNLRAIARGKQAGLGEDDLERLLTVI